MNNFKGILDLRTIHGEKGGQFNMTQNRTLSCQGRHFLLISRLWFFQSKPSGYTFDKPCNASSASKCPTDRDGCQPLWGIMGSLNNWEHFFNEKSRDGQKWEFCVFWLIWFWEKLSAHIFSGNIWKVSFQVYACCIRRGGPKKFHQTPRAINFPSILWRLLYNAVLCRTWQLATLCVSRTTIKNWKKAGCMHRKYPNMSWS